jgi:hypothetical protein
MSNLSLSSDELRVLATIAVKAHVPLNDGLSLYPLFQKIQDIVNSGKTLVIPPEVIGEVEG